MSLPPLKVKLLDPTARPPWRQTPGAAGYDIYALESVDIPAGEVAIVKSGWACAIPPNHAGFIKSRSSLVTKRKITAEAGVIDSDYTGPVGVVLHNRNSSSDTEVNFHIEPGDRIAQMVIIRIATPMVEIVDSLEETVRGDGGFGSTGV